MRKQFGWSLTIEYSSQLIYRFD